MHTFSSVFRYEPKHMLLLTVVYTKHFRFGVELRGLDSFRKCIDRWKDFQSVYHKVWHMCQSAECTHKCCRLFFFFVLFFVLKMRQNTYIHWTFDALYVGYSNTTMQKSRWKKCLLNRKRDCQVSKRCLILERITRFHSSIGTTAVFIFIEKWITWNLSQSLRRMKLLFWVPFCFFVLHFLQTHAMFSFPFLIQTNAFDLFFLYRYFVCVVESRAMQMNGSFNYASFQSKQYMYRRELRFRAILHSFENDVISFALFSKKLGWTITVLQIRIKAYYKHCPNMCVISVQSNYELFKIDMNRSLSCSYTTHSKICSHRFKHNNELIFLIERIRNMSQFYMCSDELWNWWDSS